MTEADRIARIAATRERLAPLAVAAGLPPAELDDLALVVELSERLLAVADPASPAAALLRLALEHAFKTRLRIDLTPAGRA